MKSDVKRIYSGNMHFSAHNKELSIPFIESDLSDLKDIRVSFYTKYLIHSVASGAGPSVGENYNIYLNEINVTDAYKTVLRQEVSKQSQELIKKQFIKGYEAFFRCMSAYAEDYEEELEGELEIAQSLANTGDWSAHFNQLGDAVGSYGWNGNFHPLCFLYQYIKVDSISIKAVWEEHLANASNSTLPNFELLRIDSITFSQGPSTFDPIMPRPRVISGGLLVYAVERQFKNPLEEPLKKILSRLKDTEKALEALRVQYAEPILTQSEQIQNDINRLETSLVERINVLKETVDQIQ